MKKKHQDILTSEIQRLCSLLRVDTGIYNIETCVAKGGKPYIMEVSPRGGGCKIAELQQLAFNVNLIPNEVRKAVGLPLEDIEQNMCDGYWCELVVHAEPNKSGILKKLWFDNEIQEKYIKHVDLSVRPGDAVLPFTGANMSLGDVFLRFDSREELNQVMAKINSWLHIELE